MNLPHLGPWRAGLLVALLASLVYLNTLPNAFVIDDRHLIIDNEFLRRPDGLKKIFTTNDWAHIGRETSSNYYRPLRHTVLYFWWRMFRENPAGYHVLSILLHAGVSVLVFLWLRRIQPQPRVAWLAALLFALHPIHTEAVAWISSQPDLLASFFVLLGFWLYDRAEGATGQRHPGLETGVAACLLLGLLSKEIGIVLPVILLLYEWLGRGRRPVALVRAHPLAYAGMALSFAVYLGLRWYVLGNLMPASWGFKGTRAEMVTGWIALLCEYTVQIVYPAKLSTFHVMPTPRGIAQGDVLAGLAIGGALVILGAWLYRRRRPEWLAVVLFLLPLGLSFPATTLRGDGFWLSERSLYLASVGFCWLLAVALEGIAGRAGWKPAVAVTLVLLAAYSARTLLRNQDWRHEIQFYVHELRKEKESEVFARLAHGNLCPARNGAGGSAACAGRWCGWRLAILSPTTRWGSCIGVWGSQTELWPSIGWRLSARGSKASRTSSRRA